MTDTTEKAPSDADDRDDIDGEQTDGEREQFERGLPAKLPQADPIGGMLRYANIPTELAEALRVIVNRYELRHNSQLPCSIAVVSALHGEGVTTVSQALATMMAQETGRSVCWVDCSWLSSHSGAEVGDDRPNLVDILTERADVLSAFQSSPDLPHLLCLRPGTVPVGMRNQIARSPEFSRLISLLADEFDHVVFDIPPILSNADGLAIVRRSDVSICVVRHRSTSLPQLREALEATEPTPNLGVVLNQYRSNVPKRIRRLISD